jgi:hypothetical protein
MSQSDPVTNSSSEASSNSNSLVNTILSLQQAVQSLNSTLAQQQQQPQALQHEQRIRHQPQSNSSSTFNLENPLEDEEEEEGLAIDGYMPDSIGINSKDPELSSRFRDIQHFAAGTHLPSVINFSTKGFKKSFRQELAALQSQFKILKIGLQLTEHPQFVQQDAAIIKQQLQDIFLTQFHFLNNRKKELYILQSTNGEVAQVFKSLGNEGHLQGEDQLRLAQALAFYNESQKLERQFGRNQSFRGRGFSRPNNQQHQQYQQHHYPRGSSYSRGQYTSMANRMARGNQSSYQTGSGAIPEGTTTD